MVFDNLKKLLLISILLLNFKLAEILLIPWQDSLIKSAYFTLITMLNSPLQHIPGKKFKNEKYYAEQPFKGNSKNL